MRKAIYPLLIALILSPTLFSQNGPGGNFDNNLALWLDANAIIGLTNNDPVSTWTDLSPASNDATQSGSSRPTYKTNSINGLPVISFDGVDDVMALSNLITPLNLSAIYVSRVNGSTGNYQVLLKTAHFLDCANNPSGQFGSYYKKWLSSYSNLTSTPRILAHQDIHGSNQSKLYVNGNLNSTFNNGTRSNAGNSFIGGNFASGSPVQVLNGDIAEIIVFNNFNLYDINYDLIWNYLSSKYNISITNDYYAFDITHPHEVIGIGNNGGVTHQAAKGRGIVRLQNPTGLGSSGSYCFFGHDNGSLLASSNVPAGWNGSRVNRTWRVDNTNYSGNYKLTFDLGGISIGASSDYVLLIDDDGDFSNGGTIEHYTGVFFNSGNNTVEFTNVSVPDGFYFTLGNNKAGIVSLATGNWHTPGTWSCNCIPTISDNVTIRSGHTVTLSAGIGSVDTLNILSGGTLNCTSQSDLRSIDLRGDLNISGALTGLVNLKCNGVTTTQKLNNSAASVTNIFRLTINNPNNVQVTAGRFRLQEYLTNTQGQFQVTGGSFTFVSNSTRTAYINNVTGGGFSGQFIMQRFVSSRADNWSNLASPVQFTTIGDWDASPDKLTNEIYMSGVGGINGCAGNPCFQSVYRWDNLTQSYNAVTDTTTALTQATGIELWLADTDSALGQVTFDSRGTPNFGSIVVPSLSNSSAGEWNLIGNPYMAWVDWRKVTKSQLKNEVWIFDASIGNYVLQSGSVVDIPSHQSFKVESTGSNPSATFKESSKITSNLSTFFRDYKPELTLNIISGNGYSHETHFRYNEWASENYEAEYDARVLSTRNEKAPRLVSLSKDGKELSINAINSYNSQIPLSIKNYEISKNIKLEVKNLGDFEYSCECILLKDKLTGVTYDLKSTTEINFFSSETSINDRFVLSLSDNPNCKRELINKQNTLNGYVSSNQLNLEVISSESINGNYQLLIYDMVGKLVFSEQTEIIDNKVSTTTPLNSGIYTVSLVSDSEHYSFKLKF
jgi:hypothetical protein